MEEESSEQVNSESNSNAKWLITILAIVGLVIYRSNKFEVQWTEIALFAIAVLPWFSSFMDNFKLSDKGFEATFKKELEKVQEKVEAKIANEAEKTAEKIEEVKKSSEINQSVNTFGTGGKLSSKVEQYKAELENAIFPHDPQKGKFGGSSVDTEKHRRLVVKVEKIANNDYYRRLIVRVESTDPQNAPLNDSVTFYLHPTFTNPVIEVKPDKNIAEITLVAWGAFTVGAETDNGETRLEFDIAEESPDKGDDPFFNR